MRQIPYASALERMLAMYPSVSSNSWVINELIQKTASFNSTSIKKK